MRNIKRQQGVTAVGWLIILSLIAFFVFLGLKLFPIYLENFNVQGSMNSLAKETGLHKKSKIEIRRLLNRKLSINNIRIIKKKNIKISKRGRVVTVKIDYTVRTPLMGALTLLAEFHEEAEARN
ncbi:MAG: DUF4845 domain-containing protein [Sulfuriflexus sp.]|nr:DUF4845 domain-containing protein [Sulfuriflexus sp.]